MKYCRKCGTEIREDGAFCPRCGTRTEDSAAIKGYQKPGELEEAKEQMKRIGGSLKNKRVLLAFFLAICIAVGLYAFYLSRFTLVGVWKLDTIEASGEDSSSEDWSDPKELLKQELLSMSSGARLEFTKEGRLYLGASAGGSELNFGGLEYTKTGKNRFTIHASLKIFGASVSGSYTCRYEFSGPDRLIVYLGGANMELIRDKD